MKERHCSTGQLSIISVPGSSESWFFHGQRVRDSVQFQGRTRQEPAIPDCKILQVVPGLLVVSDTGLLRDRLFCFGGTCYKQSVGKYNHDSGRVGISQLVWRVLDFICRTGFYGLCIALSIFGLLEHLKARFCLAMALLLLALAGAAGRYYYSVPSPVGILSSLSLMLFGGMWRNYQIDRDLRAKQYSIIWIVMFVAVFPIIALLTYDVDQGLRESAWNFTGSYFAALIFFMLATTILKLESRVLAFLGGISYSVYLVHPFFLELANSRVNLQSSFNIPVFVLYCTSTLVFSSLCYFVIEKRSIRLGKRINAVLDARSANSKALVAAKALSIEAGA
ncbi:acyltransferase family protein [Pseudomonas sp. B24_DOA]|nr:acyltransferase family protein [Pseudomonas sp. B24_DOA]